MLDALDRRPLRTRPSLAGRTSIALAGQQLEHLGPEALDVVAHDQIDDRDEVAAGCR